MLANAVELPLAVVDAAWPADCRLEAKLLAVELSRLAVGEQLLALLMADGLIDERAKLVGAS